MTLLVISFVAGVLTALAPCILPLLPVIVGSSLSGTGEGGRSKALVIIISLGLSVIAFTFLLKVSTLFITFPQWFWPVVSGGIIIVFGIVTLFPGLWESLPFVSKLSVSSNKLLGKGYQKKSFWGDVTIGAALGPVFSSCSPTYFIVLATVLPAQPAAGVLYLLAYVIGLCFSLLGIAFIGQRIMKYIGVASDPRGTFKRSLGAVFIIVGIAVLTGFDKKVELGITNAGFFDVTKIEQSLLAAQNKNSNNTSDSVVSAEGTFLTTQEKAQKFKKAPELVAPDGYINTGGLPITIAQFTGKKVVLLDIWTYSCINCQRTLPYVTSWYKKYEDEGLVVIGVHTPEFSFEKVQSNVEDAVQRFGITYPVVLDNEYATWNALGNQFWPRKYLIDIDGYIVYDHAGEGKYDETERAIQNALAERASRLKESMDIPTDITNPVGAVSVDGGGVGSPEVYFGSARNEYLANGVRGTSGKQTFTLPATPLPNALYLGGVWNITQEYAEGGEGSEIAFYYRAKNVYMVASSDSGAVIEVSQDGNIVSGAAGVDVSTSGHAAIQDDRLYHLIKNESSGVHILRIKVKSGTLKAFTFTFG